VAAEETAAAVAETAVAVEAMVA